MLPTNLKLVRQSVTKMTADIDIAVANARDEMMTSLIQLSKEEIKGQRPKGEKATAGQPPMNRTGNLRRSIRGEKFRIGFANYSAVVGPTIEYARAVELGGRYAPASWQKSDAVKGFPYMAPAFYKFQESGLLQSIISKHLGRG